MTLTGFIICLVLLTGGTLFFSVNTIALRIFSPVKLQEALKKINKVSFFDSFVKNSERLIQACSLYRMVSNICILFLLLALFSGRGGGLNVFSDYLPPFMIAFILFSIFSLAIPDAWAKYSSEKILSRTYKCLAFFLLLAEPVLYLLKFYDALIRRLSGVIETTPQKQQEEKQEEFLSDLEQQRMKGVVDQEEQEMIESVLELSETSVDEIMTPRTDITAVEVNCGLQTVIETINNAGHTRVPVYEKNIDSIIGFIYAKDLLTEIGKTGKDFKLRDKLRQVHFVPETKLLRTMLHEFQNQKLHIAVVLDEYGGTAGIVTLEDILEELVGEITDEYEDKPPEYIKKLDKDTIEVDARTYIDDGNEQFDLDLPEDEDYDTIGGFVFSYLGHIPKTGAKFEYKGLRFTISSAEPRKINRILIQKIRGQENAE